MELREFLISAPGKAVCSRALFRKGAFHDITSSTHDRGYAGEESLIAEQATYVQQVSLFARHFDKSPEILGPEEIRSYQVYLTNERMLAPSSIIIAVAALRFLYKITLHRAWNLEEVIPTPKKPQKLPMVLTQEEVLKFLASVRSIKHRTILTTCYAAGLRVSEAICLKVSDIDSERMLVRIRQGKGAKDRDVMLSPKLLEILREWWRVDKPKGWLFPGDRVGSHIGRHTVESVCQNAHRRCYIPKPITPHSLRHYPEFRTIQGKFEVSAPNPLLTGLGAASLSRSTRHSPHLD